MRPDPFDTRLPTRRRLPPAADPPGPLDRRPRYRMPGAIGCLVLREGEAIACLRVLNLSRRGAGLLLPVPARPGQTLLLSLTSRLGVQIHRTTLRVVRCVEAPRLGFVVGGPFAEPLDPDDWRLLLG